MGGGEERSGERYGGVWGKVRGDVGGVKKCGKLRWGVGIGEGRGMGVWGRGDG